MKKLSTFTILLLATNVFTMSLLVWGCSGNGQSQSAGTSGCPGNNYNLSCVTAPPFTTRIAVEMVNNYRQNHWMLTNNYCQPFSSFDNVTNPDLIENDARCAWFNLDTLKAFINTIETMSSVLGDSCAKLQLGIRIYYAEYPCDTNYLKNVYGISNASYAGMHTLLMIPTYNDIKSGANVDFDPYTLTNTSCTVSSVFDTLHPVVALGPTNSITARNHGGLTPPPYKYTDDWAISGAKFMSYVDQVNYGLSQNSPTRKP